MLKRIVVIVLMVMLAAMPAFAQKAEVGVTFGWVFSDGVDFGSNVVAPGGVYTRVDPKDSFGWGIDLGVFVTPQVEVGFLYNNQPSKLVVSGSKEVEVGDMAVSGYHGTFTYNTGDADAKVRGYIMGGLGATSFGEVAYTGTRGSRNDQELDEVLEHLGRRREGVRRQSCRRPVRPALYADVHQLRINRLLVRSLLGLLSGGQREVLEPVRVQRRNHVSLLTARPLTDPPSSRTARPPGCLVRRTDAAVSA